MIAAAGETEQVRRAGEADLPALAEMLARAFEDDPVSAWVSPRRGPRMRMLERFHRTRLRHFLPHGEVWMTRGGEAAALWAPPGEGRTTPRQDLELMRGVLTPALLPRVPFVTRGLLAVEQAHPTEPPHWYLSTIGTNPAAQGRGFGSALLTPVLEQCDRDGVGAYLESSKRANVDYYARFGFRVTRTLRLPSGPEIWLMWRDPA